MSASSLPSNPRFHSMALYADREKSQRANEIHDGLKVFAQGLNPVLRLWRFDVLRDANPNSLYAYLQEAACPDQLDFSFNAEGTRF